jgi:hypothetical protein
MISIILTLAILALVFCIAIIAMYIATLVSIISKEKWIWLLIVLLFPMIGMILYWLFGRNSKRKK